jgi:hypothetical protein
MVLAPQEPLDDATRRTPQSIMMFEGQPSVLLRLPIVPWVTRQA